MPAGHVLHPVQRLVDLDLVAKMAGELLAVALAGPVAR
jgi:hypothetical protein